MELERAVESCDALAMLKKRSPRRVPKDDKEKIKLFEKWCEEVGIKYHPHVCVCVCVCVCVHCCTVMR